MMQKQAFGFTTEYDAEGRLVGRTTREQEINQILGRDGSFGFGGDGGTKMSAMRQELLKIAASFIRGPKGLPVLFGEAVKDIKGNATNIAQTAKFDPKNMAKVLGGQANKVSTGPAAHELHGTMFDPRKGVSSFSPNAVTAHAPAPPSNVVPMRPAVMPPPAGINTLRQAA